MKINPIVESHYFFQMQEEFDYAKTAPWAIETGVESSFVNLARALCVVSLKGIDIKVGVYLNPTDSTYYRMIVRALVETPEQIRFNSFPDPDEQDAVLRTSAILQRIFYDNLDLYCQFVQLGNNSQSMVGGDLQLGNAKEPYFYHTHIFCRGDPDRHYLGPDLPALGGVPVGKEASAQVRSFDYWFWETRLYFRFELAINCLYLCIFLANCRETSDRGNRRANFSAQS